MSSPRRATICLVTPGHVSSTPRLLKEAEALCDAGHRVHVVAGSHHAPARALDAPILATARWDHTLVAYGPGLRGLPRKLLRRLCRGALRLRVGGVRVAARAHHAHVARFAAAAAAVPADLYLGHCLAGLPAAASAARLRGAALGFDIEDFHAEESAEAIGNPADRAAVRLLCSRLLPRCRHLGAASPLIAEACQRAYGVTPLVLLNVFPLREAPAEPAPVFPPDEGRPARLYWFSQTIGPGRGLEAAITAIGRMRQPVELHLRGECSADYRAALVRLAGVAGLRHPPVIHPSAPAQEMARLAAPHHLGLSVEEPHPPNRDLCLTNKIFTYLLAGLPSLLTPTRAQRALAADLGDAALLLDLAGHPAEAAAELDAYFASPSRLAASRAAAWALARSRFNWDHEQASFLASVERALRDRPLPA
jgi:hypothetical protein